MTGPLAVDIDGLLPTPEDLDRLRHPAVGMVILFSRNFESPAQLAELAQRLHGLRTPPLQVAVDHEGGRVQRFRNGFTRLPAMAALGRAWERDVLRACRLAWSLGHVLAAELRACGVDLSFAPVLDLDWGTSAVIGDRALHADARVVTLLAAQLMHGMAAAGMSHCGKHFPGHGAVAADSHHEAPVDERSLEEILAQDALPYRALGPALAAVMPAHVVYPRIDAHPAGYSRVWIEDILRGRLGFTGAVFSDDLSMAAARVAGGIEERAEAALSAGCDFILVCNDRPAVDRLLDGWRGFASAAAADRRARLQPRGAALAPAALELDARYRAARADVLALAHDAS
jgi:beta-N-acetylhexosaminidase